MRGVRLILPVLLLMPLSAPAELHWGGNHHGADWQVLESDHFRVFYPAIVEETANEALRFAEDAWRPVTDLVGGAPPGRIDIILRDFSDRSSGLARSIWPRIEIEPFPLDRKSEYSSFLRQVIFHEFTHVAMYYAVGGQRLELVRAPLALVNLPDWWVEGLASAAEKDRPEGREEELVRAASRSGELPRLHRLDSIDQGDLLDILLVYRLGESKVRWLFNRFGDDVVADIHHAMRPIPWSFNHALKRVTGLSEKDLDRLWKEDLNQAYGKRAPDSYRLQPGVSLPGRIERPLAAAEGSDGLWAIVAVVDEDVWFPELMIWDEKSETVRSIETDPVWPAVSWSDDGSQLLYSRRVAAPGGSFLYDLFVWDRKTGQSRRLTTGASALEGAWIPGSEQVASISYDRKTGRPALLLVDRSTGLMDRIAPPSPERQAVILYECAPSPEGDAVLVSALTAEGTRDLFLYHLGRREWSRLTRDPEPEHDPFWLSRETAAALVYREGRPMIIAIDRKSRAKTVAFENPEQDWVIDPFRGPDGQVRAVVASGRYGSMIADFPGREAALPPPPPPEWNRTSVLDSRTGDRPGEKPAHLSPYYGLREIRFRPEIGVDNWSSDGVAITVSDLLADPVDLHQIALAGDARYDGIDRGLRVSYKNRAFLPTLEVGGEWRETAIPTAPWNDERRAATISAAVPFRRRSTRSQYDFALTFTHERIDRTFLAGPFEEIRSTVLSTTIARSRTLPRYRSSWALRWDRGVDLGSPSMIPERWNGSVSLRRAFFRSDWFAGLSATGAIETGAEKRDLLLLPSNIDRPIRAAAGTAVARYELEIRFPWSEDLRAGFGPFYFERLTQSIRYAEGRAWNETEARGTVRSLTAELDLTLFTGRLIPFIGTESVRLFSGIARELVEGATAEWYFGFGTSYFSERWTSSRVSGATEH